MENRPETIARRVTVRGRVQGVGFRWATRRQARALGLGPPGAEVDSIEVEQLEGGAPGADFAIR